MISESRHWWKIFKTAILAITLLLSFFALVELFHVFYFLRHVYSPLGYTFLLLFAVGLIWFLTHISLSLKKRPKALVRLGIEDLTSASRDELKSYCKYLIRYFERFAVNPNLTTADLALAHQNIAELKGLLKSNQPSTLLLEKIEELEKKSVEPLLSKLDTKAEAELQRCVRDMMLGITFNPFRSIDLLIVIYRNADMVLRVCRIYYGRPLFLEQVLVLRDVLKVVATINYMNWAQKVAERLTSSVPIIGRASSEIAEGLGAGLLTSVAGHGAIERCRAYRQWNQAVAAQKMSLNARTFMSDIINVLKQDLLPVIGRRLVPTIPTEQIQKTFNKIAASVEATTDILIDNLIKKTAKTETRETGKAGTLAGSKSKEVLFRGADGVWGGTKFVVLGTRKGVRFVGRKLADVYKFSGRRIQKGNKHK